MMSLLDTTTSLETAYKQMVQQRAWLKNVVLPAAATLFAGSSDTNQVFQFVDSIRTAQGVIQTAVASVNATALATYVQAQINNPTYDPVADYTSLNGDLTNVISWITTNFDLSIAYTWDASAPGKRTAATFTSAQTAALLTLINSAITQLS